MNRQSLYIAFVLVLLLLSLGGQHSYAAQNAKVAEVVAVRGKVMAENQVGQTRQLAIKSPIYQLDTIKTGKLGRIQLLFADTSIISLARKTTMNIAEYKWDAAKKNGAMKTKVKEGTFRVMGGAITKFSPKHFTTETPSATIGIRGSMYAGVVSANTLAVVFQGGKGIDIMNAAGSVAITKPGYGTRVLALNQPPLPPKKFSAADMAAINNALTGKVEPAEKMQGKKQKGEETEGQKGEAPKKEGQAKEENGKGTEEGGGKQEAAGEGGSSEGGTTESTAAGESQPQEEQNGTAPASETTGTESAASTQEGTTAGTEGTAPLAEGTAAPADGTTTIATDIGALPSSDLTTTTSTTPTISTNLYDPSTDPNNIPINTTAQATALPTDGVTRYVGSFKGTESASGKTVTGTIFFGINWHSGKALGIMTDQQNAANQGGPPVFFFGSLNGTSINAKFLGTDGGDPNNTQISISALEGNGTGTLYGQNYDLFDLSAVGTDYSLSQAPGTLVQGQWDVAASAGIDTKSASQPTSPRGTSTWNGFAVGISENVNAIDVDRKLFMNNSPDFADGGFSLTVNRDNGTITGELKANQVDRMYQGGLDVNIGGTYGSAYVLDHAFGALIGCSDPSGNCVNDDTAGATTPNAPLNPHGNFLVTEGPDNQFSPYASWGYWEVSHREADGADPDTTPDMYHTHMPYSMWIAGERTPSSYISGLLNNTTFVGQYAGMARGFKVDTSGGGVSELTNGHTNLTFDFGNASAASAITGSLAFDQITLNIDSAASAINPGKFTANITNPGVISSAVNGAFYGPKVNTAAGNFEATTSTAQYIGIFGANLKNGPAP